MKRVVVVYGIPQDTCAFERHYRDVHVPLVKQMPLLAAFEASLSDAGADAENWHAIAILTYRNQADLDTSLASPEGVAAVQDVGNFASGGCQIYTCEFESF